MPNRDKTGPRGEGQKTGQGLGDCPGTIKNTNNRPLRKGLGRGWGFGLGLGRGMRMRGNRGLGKFFGWNQSDPNQDDLKEYKKALEEEIEMVSGKLKK